MRETIEQDRVFIPSKLRDNKFLGPEYVASLQMVGSDTLVRAWLEGDWTVIEGSLLRLLAIRTTCGGALRGAGPVGPVSVDGLGLGETVLGGLVGDRLR